MLSIYLARGMSGRNKADVVKEAKQDKAFFERAAINVLCPVEKENVVDEDRPLLATEAQMKSYWPEDKKLIRRAHAVIDMTPHLNSEGSKHEIGYARYFLYIPVIRVFPLGKLPAKGNVCYFEDDVIVDSREEAVEYLYRVHGTLFKRFKWRLSLYNRCLLGMIRAFIGGWK